METEELATRLSSLPGPEPRVVVSGNAAAPWRLLEVVASALERGRLFAINAPAGWPCREGLVNETPFVGAGVRRDSALDYLPMRLSLVPQLFAGSRPPDALVLHTSTPRAGKVSMGIEVNILPSALEAVRRRGGLVVAQVNRSMPYTFGDGEVPVDLIDLAVEVDDPLPSPEHHPPTDAEIRIGERVAGLIEDGATLQLGIGQVPNVAATHLASRRRLGTWSEMISDGILTLEKAGALDPERPIVSSFLVGSDELYDWADRNTRLSMRRTEVVNDPGRIATHPKMTSVNGALQVDLFAQANASFVGGAIYSGFGGQPDFVSGALHSSGGHSIIALHSWHEKSDSSAVVPVLPNPVTSFQHSAIVSEHGCAEIFGRSERAQARLIIERVADPRARDRLAEAAAGFGALAAGGGP